MKIAIVSSIGECGVYECAKSLQVGLESLGHTVSYFGVRHLVNADLFKQIRQVAHDMPWVIVEYEPGIFQMAALIPALLQLRLRGKRILFSVHEIEPGKFVGFHRGFKILHERVRFSAAIEVLRIFGLAILLGTHYTIWRLMLLILGSLSNIIVAHSPKGAHWSGLLTGNASKIKETPLTLKYLNGDRDRIRQSLGISQDQFMLVTPGFILRRKRIIEVIQNLPTNVDYYVVGTTSEYDPGYLEEIEAYLSEHPHPQVHVVQDYHAADQYLQAADAVVVYYQDIFQSAVAGMAIGAGKPCIFSDLEGFALYRDKDVGLFVRSNSELRTALASISQPSVYNRLRNNVLILRDSLSPQSIASQYLEVMQ